MKIKEIEKLFDEFLSKTDKKMFKNLDDIDQKHKFITDKAFDEIMGSFKKIISTNLKLRYLIEGIPVRPVFRQVADFNYYTRKNNKL